MARRILMGEYLHEICSFNPAPTRYEDFLVNRGQAMFDYHAKAGTEVAGARDVFRQQADITLVPTFSARGITSGGTIPQADFERIEREFREDLIAAGPVDAAYFTLHGATAADREVDPEGRLLAVAREVLGETIPIVASFDLHGVLTDRMLEHLDAWTVYHTYPHIDFYETGARAAKLLLRLMNREIRPVTAKVEIPALVRGDELITATGRFGKMVDAAKAIEQGPGGLSAGFFIGNPFTDVPDLRTYAVVCLDGEPEGAASVATEFAETFWKQRSYLQAKLCDVVTSVQRGLATDQPVALVDAADATSSGASGDSLEIVAALRAAGCTRRVLAPIVDEPAVRAAFAAGVGAKLTLELGGTIDSRRFKRHSFDVTVRSLSDGRFLSESFGQEWNSGLTAVLESGPFTIVATSRPVHLFDRSLFYANGRDPKRYDITIVKSPHCQHHMYAEWCEMISVDAPGSTSANLPTLGHTQCRRPVFPLDPPFEWKPLAKIVSRYL